MMNVDGVVRARLKQQSEMLEKKLNSDVIYINSVMDYFIFSLTRQFIEKFTQRRSKLSIILHTGGGNVTAVEYGVRLIRDYFRYQEVDFIVPEMAMSAGTIFAMSGDDILMTHCSQLGPIDPQLLSPDKTVQIPASAYLDKFEEIEEKGRKNQLTAVDMQLLMNLDPGKLQLIKQNRTLSENLIEEWLSTYKFKNWNKTEGRKKLVSKSDKERRAKEIAECLNNTTKWNSHSRGIGIKALEDIGLRIRNYENEKR